MGADGVAGRGEYQAQRRQPGSSVGDSTTRHRTGSDDRRTPLRLAKETISGKRSTGGNGDLERFADSMSRAIWARKHECRGNFGGILAKLLADCADEREISD